MRCLLDDGYFFVALAPVRERVAKRLVLVVVLLLTLDVAVHNDVAVSTHDGTRLEANWADCKVWSHVVASRDLVWHHILVVLRVWVCSEVHQELSHILSATHGCEVKRSVALFIRYVRLGSILEKQLQDLVLAIVPSSLEQGRSFVLIHLIDISMCDDEPFADVFVLLHASQCERTLSSVGHDSRIGSELEQKANDVQMVVDRGFHQAGQTQVVHNVDIKDAVRILPFLDSPVIK